MRISTFFADRPARCRKAPQRLPVVRAGESSARDIGERGDAGDAGDGGSCRATPCAAVASGACSATVGDRRSCGVLPSTFAPDRAGENAGGGGGGVVGAAVFAFGSVAAARSRAAARSIAAARSTAETRFGEMIEGVCACAGDSERTAAVSRSTDDAGDADSAAAACSMAAARSTAEARFSDIPGERAVRTCR